MHTYRPTTRKTVLKRLKDCCSSLGSRGGAQPSSEESWAAWLNASASLRQRNAFESLIRGGLYLDNLYARALTGTCRTRCVAAPPEEAGGGLRRRLGGKPKHLQNQALGASRVGDSDAGGGEPGAEGSSGGSGSESARATHLSGCRLCARKQCGGGVKGFRDVLGLEDLAAAQATLERFDLVRPLSFTPPSRPLSPLPPLRLALTCFGSSGPC